MFDHALWVLFHGLFEGLALESSRITAVAVVFLIGELLTGHTDLVGVDDNHEIAGVHVRGIGRLMLTAQDVSRLRCDTTENLVLRVDEKPLASNFIRLCIIGLHCVPPKK